MEELFKLRKEYVELCADMRLDPIDMLKRRTGRTTAIAFKTIGEAIANPGKSIAVEDHYNTQKSNRMLLEKIMGICAYTGISLIYNRTRLTVKCEIV